MLFAAAAALLSSSELEAFAASDKMDKGGRGVKVGAAKKISPPKTVYRVDIRPPEEIFREGFKVPGAGTNNNLLDHVSGRSTRQASGPLGGTTNFVSTSVSERYAAKQGTFGLLAQNQKVWVYAIQPDRNFYDVQASLDPATNRIPEQLRTHVEGPRAQYAYQQEWASQGSIRPELVHSANPVRLVNKDAVPIVNETVFNDAFRPGKGAQASDTPYEITRLTEGEGLLSCAQGGSGRAKRSADPCETADGGDTAEEGKQPGEGRQATESDSTEGRNPQGEEGPAEAGKPVADEEWVARVQRERLARHGSDVEYVTSVAELEKNPKAVLSPLRETNTTLNKARDKPLTAAEYEAFASKAAEAMSKDLKGVQAASTDSTVLAKVGAKLARGGSIAVKVGRPVLKRRLLRSSAASSRPQPQPSRQRSASGSRPLLRL
ncbi:scabin-related ADP-ribosyltransferase [Streptomyces eurocidicus]|uniref:Uncharacterized protein n=1 Tax=Streptomyces eurocidicus TaxID=66423 RepID=A0A7W8BD83_STREU|nr:enterotoxin A family protein [Streptomyces eurocidicus]MBB5121225.1 hypothetical protein [Streptomyces eurocidicus]